ncbi:MAG: BRCT domain-containing protein [Polaromonas sp.]|nr:BRCT domain-containing protein [Polaromonas sp.]
MSNPYAVGLVTEARLLRRGCESLLGIAAGLVADGELNAKEILFLSVWLKENAEIASTWPGEIIYKRVSEVMADGVVTKEEADYLKQTLVDLIGGCFAVDGAIAKDSIKLPTNEDAIVQISNSTFCFTGAFLFGTRTACEKATETRGGRVVGIGKKLNYLVIGELSSRDWKYSSFGSKIESAVQLQAEGVRLNIVSEALWVRAL